MHNSRQTPIPKGALFTVTTGQWSDYYVHGVFRATAEINIENKRDEWLDAHPEQREKYQFCEIEFLASLSHLMEPVDCWELHLCNYSDADEMLVYKVGDADPRM